ncbi:hypothetical protein LZ32DRAFT_617358 [Colletotrichum eremochloae]|nr:hypothetical protein LZ32DRAFT_617358 [Colletotrichum eremochloae]
MKLTLTIATIVAVSSAAAVTPDVPLNKRQCTLNGFSCTLSTECCSTNCFVRDKAACRASSDHVIYQLKEPTTSHLHNNDANMVQEGLPSHQPTDITYLGNPDLVHQPRALKKLSRLLERSTAMPIKELWRWWTQCRNEFGEVNSVRKAAVFFAGAEKRLSFKEVPRFTHKRSGQ